MLLAPLVRDRKGEHEKLLAGAKQAGFVRVGSTESSATSTRRSTSTRSSSTRSRSSSTAWSFAGPMTTATPGPMPPAWPTRSRPPSPLGRDPPRSTSRTTAPKGSDRLYSERYACPEHGGSFEEPGASQLQLQLAAWRLPGLHRARQPARDRPGPGAAQPVAVAGRGGGAALAAHGRDCVVVLDHPRGGRRPVWVPDRSRPSRELSERAARSCSAATTGSGSPCGTSGDRGRSTVHDGLRRGAARTSSAAIGRRAREATETEIERYMTQRPCPTCDGMRLKPEVAVGDGRRRSRNSSGTPIGGGRRAGLV